MFTYKKIKFIILTLFFVLLHFTVTPQNVQKRKHQITGKVTHNKLPLSDVHVVVKNTKKATKTDYYGKYSLRASYNDTILFSYVGYSTIEIIVKNKRSINVEMLPEAYALEETLIKSAKRKIQNLSEEDKPFKTAMGTINPRGAAYNISYFKGEQMSTLPSITIGLLGRVPSYSVRTDNTGKKKSFIRNKPVVWDVDGRVTEYEPPIILDDVLDIRVLFSAEVALRYGGMRSGGGVIIVRTKNAPYEENIDPEEKERINGILNNIKYDQKLEENENNTDYTETIKNIDNVEKAYKYCQKILSKKKSQYFVDLSLINDFLHYYNNTDLFIKLSKAYEEKYYDDIKALKAMAFELESHNIKNEYLNLHKRIFKLDYKNPKSYRDLANAFAENHDYEKAWRLYLSYLRKNQDYAKSNIGQLIFNEMEWLHHNNKNSNSSLKFTPKHTSKNDFSKDIRLVIEWNNPDTSFNINFNNNSKDSFLFKYDHEKSKEKDKPLIEEFFISDLGKHKWDIDLTYFGNKEKKATSFKVTCYYNWGKQDELKKIKTFLLNGDFVNKEVLTLSQTN